MTARRRPYLIAEIGVNHDGDPARAAAMVRWSAACGFDAVKFQYWIEDELLSASVPSAPNQAAVDQRALLRPLELALADLAELRYLAAELGVDFACTADGERALADVLTLRPDFVKVGSGDADNPWLLDAVAASSLPVVLSVGMATDEEVGWILRQLEPVEDLTVLHCVSAYPTPLASANVRRVGHLSEMAPGRSVGFSDHTIGSAAAVASLALGAVTVEKHVTHDPAAPGPDHTASLPLADAAAWVDELRAVQDALGGSAGVDAEAENRSLVRKALYVTHDLAAGSVLGRQDIEPKRPLLDGIPAHERDAAVGRSPVRDLATGERLRWSDLG
ncbi:MAG TPA: N-acetylneuraminate synthase family protein [Acidimicrobiales bacterium]|nr:N-acetylneuraminate synthase family protein [Acidimicrobiales bacterium]